MSAAHRLAALLEWLRGCRLALRALLADDDGERGIYEHSDTDAKDARASEANRVPGIADEED